MLQQVVHGCLLSLATTVVHAGGMMLAVSGLKKTRRDPATLTNLGRGLRVSGLVIVMFLSSVVEAIIWSLTYLRLGALETFDEALYFSMVTFTTLGYGDIVLPAEFRLMASFEAANGTVMFGWTAALIVAFVQRLYFPTVR